MAMEMASAPVRPGLLIRLKGQLPGARETRPTRLVRSPHRLGDWRPVAAGVAVFVSARSRGSKASRPALKGPEELEETEVVFREAFQAQASRCELLTQQLQEMAPDDQGRVEPTSSKAGVSSFSPEVPGGKTSWKEAFEAAKDFADSLEKEVEKVREAREVASTVREQSGSTPSGTGPEVAATSTVDDSEAVQKLEEVAEKMIDDETALRFIAVPILVQEEKREAKLPPVSQVRDLLSKDQLFVGASEVVFERVYILEGQVVDQPATALATMQQRLVDAGMENVELFLQRCIEPDRCAVLVMLKEDMPSSDFAWWQWLLCALAFLGTLITVNLDGFSVSAVTLEQVNAMSVDEMMKIANQSILTAVSILSVVVSMEVARRTAAAKYDVQLTPPVFVPVWPFPSVGCFGAITRQQSIVPNEDANLSMSLAAGLAGYAASALLMLIGLLIGSQENQISLNYQILPLALKLVLRPLLGEPSATEQLDPFSDPVTVAFPASPVLIGGIVGLVITSLNLLSLGRLDGKVLARSLGKAGNVAGFLSLAILVSGSLDNASNLLYATFAFYAIILQGGYNCPARDSVTEPDVGLRSLSLALVVAGIVLSIPGSLIPRI